MILHNILYSSILKSDSWILSICLQTSIVWKILKLYKDPWIYVDKSYFLGCSQHLFFGHLGTLSQGNVQVWDLSKCKNSSQARSAVEIHGAGMEELELGWFQVWDLQKPVWAIYMWVSVGSRILSSSLNSLVNQRRFYSACSPLALWCLCMSHERKVSQFVGQNRVGLECQEAEWSFCASIEYI